MKHNKNFVYSKKYIIEALGLRRVFRLSDGKRVWISTAGKEYASLSEAANDIKG